MTKTLAFALCLLAALTGAPTAGVRPGIEVFLSDLPPAVRGKRVGLITNHTGIDSSRTPDIDLIAGHTDLKLVALLAPEHGIRGTAPAGEKIADERDAKTGVPIHSLYQAEDRGPTPAMLKDVDVLVYDLQEVGGRTWTYVSTMALSMQAAARKQIPFVVLDRPNPIGGEIVEGALLDPRFKSFVGMYPIPARHGMTVGELAKLFNEAHGIGADLIVARTENRGTDRPFEQIGAPWLDALGVVAAMNAMKLPGIRFEAITMRVEPTAAKFPGLTIPAIRFAVTERQVYRPVPTALLLIDAIRKRHPQEFAWGKTIDRLTGSDAVRRAIDDGRLPALLEDWDRQAAAFGESRQQYLLYR